MREGKILKHSYRRSRLMKLTLLIGSYEEAIKYVLSKAVTTKS